jgi:hypothetical protein
VKLLRQNGAIILGELVSQDVVAQHRREYDFNVRLTISGKTNMTEWSSFRQVWYQPARNIKNFSYGQELLAN